MRGNYKLGADQFEEIIKSIDGDHNVTAIWGKMSDLIFLIIHFVQCRFIFRIIMIHCNL